MSFVLSLTLMLHADPSHKCYHLLQYVLGGREGWGREERRGEGRGEEESGSGCEERLSNVSTGQQKVAKLTTFFPLWGGMNLGWMKEQPLARASNGPGPGGR